jgi:8-oxo-dGTP diphosphatase
MTEVNFFCPSYLPAVDLTYSVIAAKYGKKWIFVRHNERDTWEIPGGHIDGEETSEEAARRELMEETGAIEFNLECVATYSVSKNDRTGFGRLYFAEIIRMGPIPDISEIAEVKAMDHLPDELTYPDIQPYMLQKVSEYLKQK